MGAFVRSGFFKNPTSSLHWTKNVTFCTQKQGEDILCGLVSLSFKAITSEMVEVFKNLALKVRVSSLLYIRGENEKSRMTYAILPV